MATVTAQLDQLTTELHSELTSGPIDFRKMVQLADEIGEQTDRLAGAFTTMAEALESSFDGDDAGTSGNDIHDSDVGRDRVHAGEQ